jgi:MFS family permease
MTPEPPYRWVILVATAVVLAIAMGLLVNGFSVFFIPLEQAFGWQRADVALINSAGLIGIAIGGIVMGIIADRVGVRLVTIFGAAAFGICVLLAAYANALWQFYTLFFLAGALGGGSLFAPLIALVGNWFRTGVGLAIGIASAGQAVGQGGMPYGSAFLIDAMGWSDALTTLGLVSLLVLIPLAMLMREPPMLTGANAAGSRGGSEDAHLPLPVGVLVIWMSAAVIMCCTCMSVPLMHLIPLIQGCGYSAPEAGGVLFTMLISGILGRIAFGKLADMIGAIPAYMTASFWQTALVFVFTQIQSLEMFYLFAPLYGFGYAGVMTGVLTTTRLLTPASKRAASMGTILAFGWLGHGLGGFQGGFFYDLTNAYYISFGNAVLAGMLNLIIVGALYFTIEQRRTVQARCSA